MERANGAKGEAALFKLNYPEVETQKMDFSLSSLASFFHCESEAYRYAFLI